MTVEQAAAYIAEHYPAGGFIALETVEDLLGCSGTELAVGVEFLTIEIAQQFGLFLVPDLDRGFFVESAAGRDLDIAKKQARIRRQIGIKAN